MVNESRNDLNDYLYGLFHGVVTDNVYPKGVPTELTQSDVEDGFMVIRAGGMYDASEFHKQTYGMIRCYVDCYIPLMSRGRYNRAKYKEMEDAVIGVIDNEIAYPSSTVYSIEPDDVLSLDDDESSNGDNRFFVFIKSFVVTIDKSGEQQ